MAHQRIAVTLGAFLLALGCEPGRVTASDGKTRVGGASFDGKATSLWREALADPGPTGGDPLLPSVNGAARQQLVKGGAKAVPVLLELLRDGEDPLREAAGLSLVEIGPEAGVGPLVTVLKTRVETNFFRARVKRGAVHALGRFGPENRAAVVALVDALAEEEVVSSEVPDVVAKFGKAAVPRLADALRANNYSVQEKATQALVKIGEPAIPALRDALHDRAFNVRYGVICSLSHMGRGAKVAVPLLIEALKAEQDKHFIRSQAACALGNIGPDAKKAVPQLVELLQDNDEFVRRHAQQALKKIDPKAAADPGLR